MARDDTCAVVCDGSSHRLGYRVEKFEESPGLRVNHVHKGMAILYNTVWTTTVYVNLKEEDLETDLWDFTFTT
jgi:hypothetical protein